MVRAVLFDLDDTLFDHGGSARAALQAVRAAHACFAGVPFDDFERTHARFLEELHLEVLAGRLALDDARRERFRRLLAALELDARPALADAIAASYRDEYMMARRAFDGAVALLEAVRARARVGIVTNNLHAEQADKLRVCGLDRLVDALVVSEEAGVSKPDPAIFALALDRLEVSPADAVMIGDSWENDVVGARRAGIDGIWFNPAGLPPPEPSVRVLRTLVPPDEALRLVFDAHRR